jgi:N-methylhydantoinase A
MAEDYVATMLMDSREADLGRIRQLLEQLERSAREALRAQGIAESEIVIQRLIDVRFKHQSHELSVTIPGGPIDTAALGAAEEAFRKLYNELYGVQPNDPCQFVNFGVRATGIVPKPQLAKAEPGDGNARRALKGARKAWFTESGGFVEVSVYDRTRLRPGDTVAGPAIMEEPDSTTICPPGYAVRVDEYLNLHINRR